MKIAIVTIGTQGDVQPFFALAQGLLAAGHEAWICSADLYEPQARALGIPFRDCGPWSVDRHDEIMRLLLAEPNPAKHVGLIFEAARKDIVDVIPAVIEATAGADLIVHHVVAISGWVAALHHGKPHVTGHLFDGLIPSSQTSPFGSSLGPLNRPLWAVVKRIIRRSTDDVVNEVLRSAGLPEARDILLGASHSRLLNLVAVSEATTRLPSAGCYRVTGPWFLDVSRHEPDAKLRAFVESGLKPIVITFGSMMGFDAQRWTRAIVDGLGGRRAVLQAGWAGLGVADLPSNLFRAGAVPHQWLFARAACVIHHGGAGTSAAVLRAGVPSSVVWFLADQPYWGKRLASLGVAAPPVHYRNFSAEWLDRTLVRLLDDRRLRLRAAALGERVRAEAGVANAVRAIEETLSTRGGAA